MDRPQREARKQEHLTAEKHGGRVIPYSGSGETVKNDTRNTEWSYEVKSTSKLSYRLVWNDLIVAERQALMDRRRMAFLVAFLGGPGARPGRYVVTTEDDFLEREAYLAKLEAKIEADC